jgi:multiple sugar transport system substrate-binding protein
MTAPRIVVRSFVALTIFLLLMGRGFAQEIVWWAPNWGQARAEKLIQTFQAANPSITVKLEITVSDGLQNRVQVALRSGSVPDVIDINTAWTGPFAATGKLLALDDLIVSSHMDLSDILPAAMGASRLNGSLYGLPYRVESHAMLYNRDLFRAVGLDPDKPPQTWDDLLTAAQKLTGNNAKGMPQYGYGLDGGGEVFNMMTRLMPFIWANGGDVISADGRHVIINEKPAVDAVAFYASLFTKYNAAPPSTLQNDGLALRRLFDNEVIAMYASGQYDLSPIKHEAPNLNLGVALLPHPNGKPPVGVLAGWSFVMPKAGRHPEATWRFVQFLMQRENMGYYTDTFPARQSAMSLPRFQDPQLQPYKEMLQYARAMPSIPAWVQIIQIVYDHMQSVLLKSSTPQQAMDSAAKQIQALLNR